MSTKDGSWLKVIRFFESIDYTWQTSLLDLGYTGLMAINELVETPLHALGYSVLTSRKQTTDPSMVDLSPFDDELRIRKTEVETFNADAALLRELGERLVGKPYIALAELVKNAYDADATKCIITIEADRITVADNGHGMSEKQFKRYWMTIGTRNKERTGESKEFRRPVTGSKGVGRLSAQFLAHKLQLVTTTNKKKSERLHAFVNWDEAIEAESLTKAKAKWRKEDSGIAKYPANSVHGTYISMEGLKQDWDEDEIKELGRQIWMLNSPLSSFGKSRSKEKIDDFQISLETDLPGIDSTFDDQMRQAIENHQAIIEGEIVQSGSKSVNQVKVSFRNGETYSEEFNCPSVLHSANWQIRVYNLSGRQGGGIAVKDMREYFEKYGGVMMYDAGFRLPYYGAESDWLRLEFDHSHRRTVSKVLPDHLKVDRALNDLPTQGRIYGVVNVNTGAEQKAAKKRAREAGEFLKIQVSRDRLVGNTAFAALQRAVRQSIDYYATRRRQQVLNNIKIERPMEGSLSKVQRIATLLREARQQYPDSELIEEILSEILDLDLSLESEGQSEKQARSLLGPLASAGMMALAMEHEVRKEISSAKSAIKSIKRIAKKENITELSDIIARLSAGVNRMEKTRGILQPMLDQEDREVVEPLIVGPVVKAAVKNVKPFLGRMNVQFDIRDKLFFPAATMTEWTSVIQNVMLNAANATLDEAEPKVEISALRNGQYAIVTVSDNGIGIDGDGDELFQPFVRHSAISDERRELGLGGTGLGLTIVDMIATQRGCEVRFVEPDDGWSTTFEMSWRAGDAG